MSRLKKESMKKIAAGELFNFVLVKNLELIAISDEEMYELPEGGKIIAQFNDGEDVEQFLQAVSYLRPDINIKQ